MKPTQWLRKLAFWRPGKHSEIRPLVQHKTDWRTLARGCQRMKVSRHAAIFRKPIAKGRTWLAPLRSVTSNRGRR
jgi:hypothetical protein